MKVLLLTVSLSLLFSIGLFSQPSESELIGQCVTAWSNATRAERDESPVLKDSDSVLVVVASPGLGAARAGLTREVLQTDVELRLRRAGISVGRTQPALMVSINSMMSGFVEDLVIYSIEVSVLRGSLLFCHPVGCH